VLQQRNQVKKRKEGREGGRKGGREETLRHRTQGTQGTKNDEEASESRGFWKRIWGGRGDLLDGSVKKPYSWYQYIL
jgi:hypothetical protein